LLLKSKNVISANTALTLLSLCAIAVSALCANAVNPKLPTNWVEALFAPVVLVAFAPAEEVVVLVLLALTHWPLTQTHSDA
jgi:hypothetical protein